jgi:hypothetical protein
MRKLLEELKPNVLHLELLDMRTISLLSIGIWLFIQLVIQETKVWLSKIGLSISEEKSARKLASQTFIILGFQIAYVRVQSKFRVKITPSKANILRIIEKVRKVVQNNKAASAYQLIGTLKPLLLGCANYFQFC